MSNNKSAGREFALKFLFQFFLKDNQPLKEQYFSGELTELELNDLLEEFKESYVSPDDEHPNNELDSGNWFFAQKLLSSLPKNIEKIEDLILKESKKSMLSSLEKVERGALTLGVLELLTYDTPYQVVINEFVELSKRYGGAESSRFVNGVLDGIREKHCSK